MRATCLLIVLLLCSELCAPQNYPSKPPSRNTLQIVFFDNQCFLLSGFLASTNFDKMKRHGKKENIYFTLGSKRVTEFTDPTELLVTAEHVNPSFCDIKKPEKLPAPTQPALLHTLRFTLSWELPDKSVREADAEVIPQPEQNFLNGEYSLFVEDPSSFTFRVRAAGIPLTAVFRIEVFNQQDVPVTTFRLIP